MTYKITLQLETTDTAYVVIKNPDGTDKSATGLMDLNDAVIHAQGAMVALNLFNNPALKAGYEFARPKIV